MVGRSNWVHPSSVSKSSLIFGICSMMRHFFIIPDMGLDARVHESRRHAGSMGFDAMQGPWVSTPGSTSLDAMQGPWVSTPCRVHGSRRQGPRVSTPCRVHGAWVSTLDSVFLEFSYCVNGVPM